MTEKRITWEEYFMHIAILSSWRSADPNTKVGACIVDNNNHVISTGYNGMPANCDDNAFPWEKNDNLIQNKHSYVVHAELNAILNAHQSLQGCTLYVTLFPCNECAKAIVQSGIKNIVYLDDSKHNKIYSVIARKILNAAKIKFKKYNTKTLF